MDVFSSPLVISEGKEAPWLMAVESGLKKEAD
jgi:hypothetical protein